MLLLYGTDNSLQISSKLQMASKIAALRGVAGQWQSTCLAARGLGLDSQQKNDRRGRGKGSRERKEGKHTFPLR